MNTSAGLAHSAAPLQERLWWLVVLPIVVIPLENQWSLGGLSPALLAALPLPVAVFIYRRSRFWKVVQHPVLLLGAVLLAWGCLMEWTHQTRDLSYLVRVGQNLGFAALLAALLADRRSLQRTLLTLPVVSVLFSLYLIVNLYGTLSQRVAGYRAASSLRLQAFQSLSLEANLNIIAFTVAMGAVVALAKLLTSSTFRSRVAWLLVYGVCSVGTTIPLSRSAFLIWGGASLLLTLRYLGKIDRTSRVLLFLTLLVVSVALVPDAMFARFSSLTGSEEVLSPEGDARLRILQAALKTMPEYWALGVGAGEYWNHWSVRKGFAKKKLAFRYVVPGPHNAFLTVWIFFGLPALVLLVCLCLAAACHVPQGSGWETMAIFGLLVVGLGWLFVTHNLYLKQFGLLLGLLVACSHGTLQEPAPSAAASRSPALPWAETYS